jgi:trigger factor
MKLSHKKLPGSVIELEVVLNQKEFEPYWQSVYEKALNEVEIRGFRKGTAPKEIADQAIDKDKIFEEAVRNAIRFNLDEITKKNNWTVIDKPVIEILENPPAGGLNDGLKYKARLVIFPEIKIGDYKKIAKKVFKEKKEVNIESEEIKQTIQWLLNSRAKISLVSREAKTDDLVNIDIEGSIDGKAIIGSKISGDKFILGQGYFLPGFEEKIIGHKADEELNFTLIAPNDYWKEELRNEPIDFKVKINGVFERVLPELNDDFAKGLGPNFQTVQDLEKSMAEGLLAEKENKEKERLRIKMFDEIIKASEIDIPEIMVEKTAEMLGASDKNKEEMKTIIKARAKNNVAVNLVIYKIAEIEKLQPTKEEIALETARHDNHNHGHEFDERKEYDYSYQIAQNKKVFEFLEALK